MKPPKTTYPYTEQQSLSTGPKYSRGEKVGTAMFFLGTSTVVSSLMAELPARASNYAGVSATFLNILHTLGGVGMLLMVGGGAVLYFGQSQSIIRKLGSENSELKTRVRELEQKLVQEYSRKA